MPLRQPRLYVTALSTVCLTLASASAAQADTVTRDFAPTGSAQTYVVPAGVTELQVTAIGGRGGNGGGPLVGGLGARVTDTVTVAPGSRLWVMVGRNGADAGCASGAGWNGGATGGTGACHEQGASGGGASDVRVCEPGEPCDAESGSDPLGRLLVAGGGGGAARYANSTGGSGGSAGAAGQSATDVRGTAGGGGAGTTTVGGAAGGSGDTATGPQWEPSPAAAGTLGAGGVGGTGRVGAFTGGGGGGGGLYGGGGGGSANYYAGGGGGGSSLVPTTGGTLETTADDPSVTIAYEVGAPATVDAPTLEDTTVYADGTSTTTVTAVARDANGIAASGAEVTFSGSAPQPQFGPTTDNGDGSYTATVTAAGSRGTTAITARLVSASQTSAPVSLQQIDRPTVTSPVDGTPVLDVSGGPGKVTVSGTADPLTTAVSVHCVTRNGVVALEGADEVSVENGRWSVSDVPLPDSAWGNVHCRLVAIATGVAERDAEALPGPALRRLGLDRDETPLGLASYYGTAGGTTGEATFGAFGPSCGLSLSRYVDRDFDPGTTWLGCGAAFSAALDSLPALVVDGRPAHTAGSAADAEDELENAPMVTVDTRIDADGSFVVTETGPVRRCATTSACTALVDSGVTATVRTRVAPSGASGSRTVDFASVDGASHEVAMTLQTTAEFDSPEMREGSETTWRALDSTTRTTNAPARHTVQIRDAHDADIPAIAVTAVPGPRTQDARGDRLRQRFTRTVPAGGVAGVAMRFDLVDVDAVAAAGQAARDDYAVGVGVSTPAAGTSTGADAVTLTGTAFDRSGDVALRVAGQATTVAADGSWTATIPLSVGQNTIEAVVESRYGVRETATLIVTRTTPVTPIDQGPDFHPPVTPNGPMPPAGPTPPAGPAPPVATAQLLRKVTVPKRVRLAQARKRGVSIPLTLSTTGARITAELRGPWGTFARGTASQAKRGATTLRLKPTRKAATKAAKALRRAKSKTVRLQLKLTVRDANGATQTVTRTIQLRR